MDLIIAFGSAGLFWLAYSRQRRTRAQHIEGWTLVQALRKGNGL